MAEPVGFYTDTTVCIGCKACEVACHQWNALPARNGGEVPLSGLSYDNTVALSDVDWRHVKFIEQFSADRTQALADDVRRVQALRQCALPRGLPDRVDRPHRVRHGLHPGARLQRLPRLHHGLPVRRDPRQRRKAHRPEMHVLLRPAPERPGAGVRQACPTRSIQFGPIAELKQHALDRVGQLHGQGASEAYLYGADTKILGGLNAFYLLMDPPETYGLPTAVQAQVPSRSVWPASVKAIAASLVIAFGAFVSFGRRKRAVAMTEGKGGSSR